LWDCHQIPLWLPRRAAGQGICLCSSSCQQRKPVEEAQSRNFSHQEINWDTLTMISLTLSRLKQSIDSSIPTRVVTCSRFQHTIKCARMYCITATGSKNPNRFNVQYKKIGNGRDRRPSQDWLSKAQFQRDIPIRRCVGSRDQNPNGQSVMTRRLRHGFHLKA
jgi:hypothetical protein